MYRFTRFGSTSLVHYNQVDDIGTGETPTAYITLPEGGALDGYGSAPKRPGVVERVIQRRLRATTLAALSDLFFGLQALVGTRAKLLRVLAADGTQHWMYARLKQVNAQRTYEVTPFLYIQDIELVFTCQESAWHGISHTEWLLDSGVMLDDGYILDAGIHFELNSNPKTLTITLGTEAGRAPVRSVKITVDNDSDTTITKTIVTRTGGETLTYNGDIASGRSLEIDTGTMQITAFGADPYDDLVISATADMAAWFTLEPGANEITVTLTGYGDGDTITFEFDEAWY